jgi:hypothetical protein
LGPVADVDAAESKEFERFNAFSEAGVARETDLVFSAAVAPEIAEFAMSMMTDAVSAIFFVMAFFLSCHC